MTDINNLVRENVRKLKPYSCARDEFKGSTGIFLDANENPYGKLNRYPDPCRRILKRRYPDSEVSLLKTFFLAMAAMRSSTCVSGYFASPEQTRL